MTKMRSWIVVGVVAASALGCLLVAQAADSSSPPNVDEEAKALFFSRLQAVSDQADLFDPTGAEPLLGMTLSATTQPQKIYADCSKTYGFQSILKTTVSTRGEPWYHPLASGRGHVSIPGFAINPASATGDAALIYTISRYVQCRDQGSGLVDSREATLLFDGLPSFACITTHDIERLLPAATFLQATDGVSLYRYQGKVNDEFGTMTEFGFRAGVGCAISASIQQKQLSGWRYLNANDIYQTCRVRADRSYCAAHPDIRWPDDEALKDLIRTSDGMCGTPDSIYREHRPVDGPPPPSLPRHRNWSRPC